MTMHRTLHSSCILQQWTSTAPLVCHRLSVCLSVCLSLSVYHQLSVCLVCVCVSRLVSVVSSMQWCVMYVYLLSSRTTSLLRCALATCGAVYCNRSCLWVCDSWRAGGVRTLLQPARVQRLDLSERFFHM